MGVFPCAISWDDSYKVFLEQSDITLFANLRSNKACVQAAAISG